MHVRRRSALALLVGFAAGVLAGYAAGLLRQPPAPGRPDREVT